MALAIISILHLSIISSRSLGQKKGGDFLSDLHSLAKQEGRMNIFSMKTILMNYVESNYPDMKKSRQATILKILAHKIKEKMFTEIMKEKEDMFARMLR